MEEFILAPNNAEGLASLRVADRNGDKFVSELESAKAFEVGNPEKMGLLVIMREMQFIYQKYQLQVEDI